MEDDLEDRIAKAVMRGDDLSLTCADVREVYGWHQAMFSASAENERLRASMISMRDRINDALAVTQ